jgi:transposase
MPPSRVKLYTSLNWMRNKYVVQGLSEQEIAVLAGTTQVTINRWLHTHGLKRKR